MTNMEKFMFKVNTVLEQLVDKVDRLTTGQENQTIKIDSLALHLSEFKKTFQVYLQKEGNEVSSGILAPTSDDRVVSSINEFEVVSDESFQSVSNKEDDEEAQINPEDRTRSLLKISENDDSDENIDHGAPEVISTEENTDNNRSNEVSATAPEDSDCPEITSNNLMDQGEEEADSSSQNILPQDLDDDDEMGVDLFDDELSKVQERVSPERDVIPESDSETDFECSPVKIPGSIPEPEPTDQQLSPVKVTNGDLHSDSDDMFENDAPERMKKNDTKTPFIHYVDAQEKSAISSSHDSDVSMDLEIHKTKKINEEIHTKLKREESDSDNEDLYSKLQARRQGGDSASRNRVLRSDSSSESESDYNYQKYVDERTKKKNEMNAIKNKLVKSESESDDLEQFELSMNMLLRRDPKLRPGACKVVMARIPEVIFSAILRGEQIIVDETDEGLKKDDPLTRAIKQLMKFQPILHDKNKKITKKVTKNKDKKSSRKVPEEVDLRSDGSSSEESRDTSRVKRYPPLPLDDDMANHRVDSDDEELDALNSDSDESVARKLVLKGSAAKNLPLKSKSQVKNGTPSGGHYFTPKCVLLSSTSDSEASEHSDDDDFVSLPHKKKKKKTIIYSDSDDIQSRSSGSSIKRKKGSSSSIEEVSIHSDDYKKSKFKRKHGIKRRSPVESNNSDSDFQVKKKRKSKIYSESNEDKGRDKGKPKNGAIITDFDDDIQVVEPIITEEPAVTEELAASQGAGRKNIRSIISKKDLQKQTRIAQEAEQKRKERIAEKQKLFNGSQLIEDSVLSTDVVLKDLVLDIDESTKEPIISLDPEVVKKLKPHQARGISFLWDSCFESVEQYKKPNNEGSGCILAHCMGLGKTLQTVGFLHSIMTSDQLSIKSALVICPLNTVGNWANEIKMWLSNVNIKLQVHKLHGGKNIDCRVKDLEIWHRQGGVGIIHYDRFRQLVEGKKKNESYQPKIDKCLLDPGPDMIICDEAHIIKNSKSKVSLAINRIRTKRRILLTGTPLQNNLTEYHTMMQFVKPNLLGSIKEFRNRFVNPITNGQHRDSNDHDVRVMKKRAHVLHKLLDGCVQRLDYSVLVPYLPPKYEYVLLIKLTDIQKKLYKHYLNSVMGEEGSVVERVKQRRFKFLGDFITLSKVWSHPYSLSLKHTENDATGHPKDFVDNVSDVPSPISTTAFESDCDIDWLDSEEQVITKKKLQPQVKQEVITDPTTDTTTNKEPALSSSVIEQGGDWWSQFFPSKDDMMALEHSTKLIILFEILKTCESIGDKVLVFSQSLSSLNIIENLLKDLDKEAEKIGNEIPSTFGATSGDGRRWRINKEYYRIDGSTKTEDRQRSCDKFNKKNFNNAKLFLISTKAGGLGINLIGANRVVIFDASWNPSQDLQSIFRVFRFGQTKPCYIYRFLAQGTMEEKVYNRQVVKLSLSGRVIDEHQIERHFKFDDIVKMYDCDFEQKPDRPTPAVPKDRLLADLLISHKDILDNYLEHDSLLVNQADEGLSEEERQLAWNEYQNEKDVVMKPITNNGQSNEGAQYELRIRQRLSPLYPNLSDVEMQCYCSKVRKELDDIQQAYRDYYSGRGYLGPSELRSVEVKLTRQREEVQRFFSEPGYLRQVMTVLGRQQGSSTNSSTINTFNDGIRVTPMNNNLESDGIRVRPMNNVEQPSDDSMMDCEPRIRVAPMSSILESHSKTPASSSNFMPIRHPVIRNPGHTNDQTRPPFSVRSIPTTVSYNPLS